jgi:hypothetical protein
MLRAGARDLQRSCSRAGAAALEFLTPTLDKSGSIRIRTRSRAKC